MKDIIKFYTKSVVKYNDTTVSIENVNKSFVGDNSLIISFETYQTYPRKNVGIYNRLVNNDISEINIFKHIHMSKLFIRDVTNSWYINGIQDSSLNSIQKILHFLKYIIHKYKFKHIFIYGFSMGAYAALLYGKLLSIEILNISINILSMCPITHLHRYINYLDVLEYKKKKQHPILIKNKFDSWLFKTLRSNVWPYIDNMDNKYIDLLNLYKINTNNLYCTCICSAENRVDTFHIERLRNFVHPFYINAGTAHLIYDFLYTNNMWDDIIYKFINNINMT